MPTPSIYTRTPIEAVIQQTGMEAQGALASIIMGTPVFYGAAMVIFMYRFGGNLYQTGMGNQSPNVATYNTTKALLMVLTGWLLIGSMTVTPVYIGPIEDRSVSWDELEGVKEEPAYQNIRGSRAVWGYSFINSIVEELTAQVNGAVKSASRTPEPTDQILGLMTLQATSLGVEHAPVASSFNTLVANCTVRDAKVLERGTSAKELFDLDKAGCGDRWDTFDREFKAAKETMVRDMSDKFSVWNMGSVPVIESGLQAGIDLWGADEGQMENMAFKIAMENHIARQAGRVGVNSQRQTGATFSDSTGDTLNEAWQGGPFGEAMLAIADLNPWGGDVHAEQRKAEAANKFNEYADLIPSLRGFLHALFAVVYPLCAFAVALGWFGPFKAWLIGRFTLGLYTPAATLLYAMTASLTEQSQIGSNPRLDWVTSDEFTLGGVALLDSEITRIQSSYLMCEMAVFTGFMVGSVSMLRMGFNTSSNMTRNAGAGVRSVVGMATSAYGAVGMAGEVAGKAARTARSAAAPGAGLGAVHRSGGPSFSGRASVPGGAAGPARRSAFSSDGLGGRRPGTRS